MNRMMSTVVTRTSPDATTLIRRDHAQVLATFHRYRIDLPPDRKYALAESICRALEIHARLEEEIFYPVMRSVAPDLVDKSIPEHNQMRRLIAQLKATRPQDQAFDTTLMELMRDVMRHVADEETMLLPDAERILGDRLGDLGAEMTRRRFELAAPRAGDLAADTVRSFPVTALAVSGMFVLGAVLLGRAATRPAGLRALAAPRALRDVVRPNTLHAVAQKLAHPNRWGAAPQPWWRRVRHAAAA
jgi:hemerythrin superfamily protein